MKRLLVILAAIGLLLLPFAVYAQSDQKTAGAPPILQTLVPEGDFALKLAAALKLGTPSDEGQAEDILTSVGIAPKNGWIADYPITPNIFGELQDAVSAAAGAKKLPMQRDEALRALRTAAVELEIPIIAEIPGPYGETPFPQTSQYTEPGAIDHYYDTEGPPAVTYYPPPRDYNYLYTWVPYSFWCSGFFFPGFFVLNDFNIVVTGRHHHQHLVTNHFIDPKSHRVTTVDPISHTPARVPRTTAFNSMAAKRAAFSIFSRSTGRMTLARGTEGSWSNHASMPGGAKGGRGVPVNQGGNTMDSRVFAHSNRFGNGVGMNPGAPHSYRVPFTRGPSGESHSGRSLGGLSGGSHAAGGHSFGGFSGSHAGGRGR